MNGQPLTTKNYPAQTQSRMLSLETLNCEDKMKGSTYTWTTQKPVPNKQNDASHPSAFSLSLIRQG